MPICSLEVLRLKSEMACWSLWFSGFPGFGERCDGQPVEFTGIGRVRFCIFMRFCNREWGGRGLFLACADGRAELESRSVSLRLKREVASGNLWFPGFQGSPGFRERCDGQPVEFTGSGRVRFCIFRHFCNRA